MVEEKQKLYLNAREIEKVATRLAVEEKQKLYLNKCLRNEVGERILLKRNKSCI